MAPFFMGLAMVLGLVSTSLAADAPTIEGMRLGFGPEAMFRQATWTPVWADVRGGSDPGIVLLEVIAPDDDGVLVRQRQPVRLKAGELKSVAGFVRPGLLDAEIRARLLDEDGNPLGRPFVLSPKERLEPYSLLVLTAGKISGVKEMPSIARFRGATGSSPELVVKPLDGRWPEAWYGYEGVEAVVLETGDPATLKPLQGQAGDALRTWVRQGGHLVVALGPGAAQQQTVDALGEMLPATAEGSVRLTDVGSLESFAGSGLTTSGHPLAPPMTVTKLQGWDERGGVPLASALATPLVVKGPFGLGTVTVVGIDVAHEPFAGWKDEKFFWDKVLGIPGQAGGVEGITSGTGGAFIESGPSDLSARLHRALEAFPDVWLVPFGWVAFFIFVYILLIGPLDYLFLRKIVKRMELTWVTFPLMVVAVSALAYAGAYSVKGNSLRVNKVDALDFDQTTGAVRGSSWLTVFSPQNRDYDVSLTPLGANLDRGEPATLEPGDLALTWFGSPDPALGGVGRIASTGSGYLYEPEGQVEALAGVRIPIWSTRSFSARWVDRSRAAVLESDIQTVGGDRVSGSVRNLLKVPLTNAQLYYGRNVYDLGTIRPRGIARVDPTRTEAMTRYLGRLASSFDAQKAPSAFDQSAGQVAQAALTARAGLIRAAMFHDAMGTRASENPSRPLRSLDLSGQVNDLHRPMLVAEVQAPAAELNLDGGQTKAEISQTTVLRVVLPMGSSSTGL